MTSRAISLKKLTTYGFLIILLVVFYVNVSFLSKYSYDTQKQKQQQPYYVWQSNNGKQNEEENWCDVVSKARENLDPSLHIKVPCEKMKPATSAVVCMLTAGVPDGKGTRTVFTGTDYVNGALALGASLDDNLISQKGHVHKLLLIKEGFTLPDESIQKLEAVGWILGKSPDIQVDKKYTPSFARYKNVYPKISVIGLAEYKCVLFMDADTLTISNIDELMTCNILDRPEYRVAGGLDYYRGRWFHFNTGSVLWRPSSDEMTRVYQLTRDESFMKRFESDQIFINTVYPDRTNREINELILKAENDIEALENLRVHFGQVAHLPWAYNAQTHVEYQLPEFWDEHLGDAKILHFTQKKGWQCPQTYEKPKSSNASKCDPKTDSECACREGYRWHIYLKKALEEYS